MNKKIVVLLVLATSSNAYSEDNTAEEIRRLTGRIEVLEREVAEFKRSLRGENTLETAKNYITQKKYEESVELLADMYKASPNGPEAAEVLYLLASCFKELKKLDKANTILEKVAGEYTGKFADRARQELRENKQQVKQDNKQLSV